MDLIALHIRRFASPFLLYSGSTRAEHKYMASYFTPSGVFFNKSRSLICLLINCFIKLFVVGKIRIHAIGPFLVRFSIMALAWIFRRRAITFPLTEIWRFPRSLMSINRCWSAASFQIKAISPGRLRNSPMKLIAREFTWLSKSSIPNSTMQSGGWRIDSNGIELDNWLLDWFCGTTFNTFFFGWKIKSKPPKA